MIITFSQPYDFEGKKYDEVELKTDDLGGQGLIALQKKYLRLQRDARTMMMARSVTLLVVDSDFLIFAAAELAGKPQEFFTALPVGEFLKVLNEVQAFFTPAE